MGRREYFIIICLMMVLIDPLNIFGNHKFPCKTRFGSGPYGTMPPPPDPKRKLVILIAASVCWVVWKLRNRACFDHKIFMRYWAGLQNAEDHELHEQAAFVMQIINCQNKEWLLSYKLPVGFFHDHALPDSQFVKRIVPTDNPGSRNYTASLQDHLIIPKTVHKLMTKTILYLDVKQSDQNLEEHTNQNI